MFGVFSQGIFRGGVGVWSYMYQDIVQVADTENIEILPQGIIDKPLAGCGSICKAKGQYQKFIQAILGAEGSL